MRRRPYLECLSCMHDKRLVRALLPQANGGDLGAQNRLVNLVPPEKQVKLLDRWGITNERLSTSCLGEVSIS